MTIVEKQYKELKARYNRTVDGSENFSSELNIAIERLGRPFSENNLKALQNKQNKSADEEEYLEECKFVEKHKDELKMAHQNYMETIYKIHSAFKDFVPLVNKYKELNGMLEVLKEESEFQDRESDIKQLEEELSASRTEIDSNRLQLVNLYNKADGFLEKFNNLADKEVFETALKEHMAEFNIQNKTEEKRNSEKAIEEEKQKQAEKIKAEEEKQKAEREKEWQKQQEKLKAEKQKAERDASIRTLTEEAEYYSFEKQETLNGYANEFLSEEVLNDPKKYFCNGIDREITLKEAFGIYKDLKQKIVAEGLKNGQEHLKNENSAEIDDGLGKASNLIDTCITDKTNVRERAKQFGDIKDYTGVNIDIERGTGLDFAKYSELIGVTNGLAKLHNQTKKPGFFSRLFNTKYNQAYNREQEIIDSYKEKLINVGHIDSAFVNKITDKQTCYNGINKSELTECFYNNVRKAQPNSILFRTEEDVKKIAENTAKMSIISDIYNGRSPVDTINRYFKNNEQYIKANNLQETVSDKDISNGDLSKNKNERVRITVEEASLKKQEVKKVNIKQNEKEKSIENEKAPKTVING